MNGLKKAILYSLKPHELGYCGPQGSASQNILKEYLLGKKYSDRLIREMLNEFKGAVSYYHLIAQANNIKDCFSKNIIEAYWLGNELLDKVKADDLGEMILDKFIRPELLTKAKARQIVSKIPAGVVAHHSFHVFFVGSITGRVKITPKHKDICKTSWGEVVSVFDKERKVEVKTQKLFPSKKDVKMEVDWDKQLLPKLKIGDLVSFHWGRISEKLSRNEYNNLIRYTMKNYNESKRQHKI